MGVRHSYGYGQGPNVNNNQSSNSKKVERKSESPKTSYVSTNTRTGSKLSQVMLRVYLYTFIGILLSTITAYAFANVPYFFSMIYEMQNGILMVKPAIFIVLFAPVVLLLILALTKADRKMSTSGLLFFFVIIALFMGAALSIYMLIRTNEDITQAFLITAAVFGVMTAYGYITKKDLSHWGNALFGCLIGLLIALVINLFLGSSTFSMLISMGAVVLFSILTIYDTHMIKRRIEENNGEDVGKIAAFGAFSLYLNFMNILMHILRLKR